jgi:hypothetical protein
MKIVSVISILMLILITSCKKNEEKPYTLKFYGDAYEDIGYSATIVSDGYIIAGQLTEIIRTNGNYITSSNKNMGIIKTGWNGNVIWKVSAGGKSNALGSKIYQVGDGSLICVGTFTDTTTATPVQTDVFIVKVSATGAVEWQKHYGGAGNQTGKDIVQSPDGYIILGSTDVASGTVSDSIGNTAGNKDIFLLKVSAAGDSIGSFAYGYHGNDIGMAIKPDIGGNYIILGTTDRSWPGQAKNNLFLVRINDGLSVTDQVIIGGTDDEYAADMEVLPDGYLIAYTVVKDAADQQIYVQKLKNNIHNASYPPKPITITDPNTTGTSAGVYAISRYKTDSFLLAGYMGAVLFPGYTGASLSSKMLIFELDANGDPVPGHQMIQGSTGVQVAYDVMSGDDEYIIAVGKDSYDVNSMMTFLKFMF